MVTGIGGVDATRLVVNWIFQYNNMIYINEEKKCKKWSSFAWSAIKFLVKWENQVKIKLSKKIVKVRWNNSIC